MGSLLFAGVVWLEMCPSGFAKREAVTSYYFACVDRYFNYISVGLNSRPEA